MPITHGSGRCVDLGLWALEKHRLLQGYLARKCAAWRYENSVSPPYLGVPVLTLCASREPGVPGAAGSQLSKLRHQPCLINSQRGEGAGVDIWSLTARKWLGIYIRRNNYVFLYVLKYRYFLKCHFLELPLLCLSIKYVYGAGRRLEWWEICLWDAYTTLPATRTPHPPELQYQPWQRSRSCVLLSWMDRNCWNWQVKLSKRKRLLELNNEDLLGIRATPKFLCG